MPLYEYGCSACGKVSEISHRISDPPAVDCPVCGKPALSKHVSAAGFRLKGAGWYETDFKSDGKRNLAGDAGGADAKPAADGAKADAKTETAKADTKKADTKTADTKTESKPAAAATTGTSAASN